MIGERLLLQSTTTTTFKVLDSLFDGTAFTFSGLAANGSYATYNYNAYTNTTRPFPAGIGGANDVPVSSSFNWRVGALGNYYLPTNSTLINTGSVTAPNIALYHFTTQVGQTAEETTQVDIGYHYIALDSDGLPKDVDGNSVADYTEDANQNGIPDGIETLLGFTPASNNQLGSLQTSGYSVWLATPKFQSNQP